MLQRAKEELAACLRSATHNIDAIALEILYNSKDYASEFEMHSTMEGK